MKTVTAFIAAALVASCAPEMVSAPRRDNDPPGDFIPIPMGPGGMTGGDPIPIPIDSGVRDTGVSSPADASATDVRTPPPLSPPSDSGVAPPPPPPPPSDSGIAPPPPPPPPPPAGSTCARACQHVYRDCMMGFRSSSGANLTEAQCVSVCEAGQFRGAESCLATAACTSASLNACFSSSPPPPSDAGTPPADASGGSSAPPGTATALEDEVLALTNARRAAGANCGGTMFAPAPPLRMNEVLRGVARAHSTDMGTRNYFDHNSRDGRTPFQRMMAAGYNSSPMGENIAAGNGTAAATVTQWMNSPGHCRNIMNPGFRALGVGYANVAGSTYRHYWTQNFGGM